MCSAPPNTDVAPPSSPGGPVVRAPSSPGESDSHTLCSSSASAAVTSPLLSSAPPAAFHLVIHQI